MYKIDEFDIICNPDKFMSDWEVYRDNTLSKKVLKGMSLDSVDGVAITKDIMSDMIDSINFQPDNRGKVIFTFTTDLPYSYSNTITVESFITDVAIFIANQLTEGTYDTLEILSVHNLYGSTLTKREAGLIFMNHGNGNIFIDELKLLWCADNEDNIIEGDSKYVAV